MTIQDRYLEGSRAAAAAGAAGRTDAGKQSVNESSASGGDEVHFSEHARFVSQALQAGSAARESRVQSIARQYAQGTYRVDAEAVSRALVREAGGKA